MLDITKLPNVSLTSSIDEAQALVRRCAEPRSAGDTVKGAVRRASQRLDIPFTRVRDIWYGDARRIDADEMDKLRQTAEEAEFAQAVAAIEFLRTKLLISRTSLPHRVAAGLQEVLLAYQSETAATDLGGGLQEVDHMVRRGS